MAGKKANTPPSSPVEGPTIEARELVHLLGNPLHIIAGRARLLLKKMSENETAKRNLDIILSQAERMEGIIREFLDRVDRRGEGPDQPGDGLK